MATIYRRAVQSGSKPPGLLSDSVIRDLALCFDIPFKTMMIHFLTRNIWPKRFWRNQPVISAKTQARLLTLRVFIAGCGGLGGEVASLLARLGVGAFRLCDPDVFEETNLNRQRFCTEKTIGKPKVLVAKAGLLEIASWLEVEALVERATPENLPDLLTGMDIAIDCLDSVERKKMLADGAAKAGIPFLHGAVLFEEGFAFFDQAGKARLAALYPEIAAGLGTPGPNPVLATTVTGTAVFMASLLLQGLEHSSPLLHLDLSIPELDVFPD